ncbi:MAG TPA: bifunctional dTDP-4-dehydrorhamnose 3,5-epimerase family protein/NAD(P)-dependent oxidoreductase [Propionibacteriaceae bacterium]|nr:bifunctional dTDP-4-dehydrorhamnose 3,5-epimerase family protein/NAD(P)-dependent oxidoreductase [Propionibacteriaceae bacterium]
MNEITVLSTPIPGLLVVELPVHHDNRGWFKENWQRQKMTAAGVPDFGPVQNNVSFNTAVGVTRGFHAEPWDKFVSVATGSVFGAWVDLRAGDAFGACFTTVIGPDRAVFVPSGVGNAFQTLEPETAYSYLVNDHWSAEAKKSYAFVSLADPSLKIEWPIPLDQAELSAADAEHPDLTAVSPSPRKQTLILGANGQLGRALHRRIPEAIAAGRDRIDLSDPAALTGVNWREYDTVINAAAYTAVDAAETADGRRAAWETNVAAVGRLAEIARAHRLTLVHVSSDYVFDGTVPEHREDEPFSPLGVYGQTKAAGDALVATVPRHYIVRTSWVVGEGKNFVATMASLAQRGTSPAVVDDQYGRLSFADDIADGICHLLETGSEFGVYNLTADGEPASWADIAAYVFELCGRQPSDVRPVSTAEYSAGKTLAPRPPHSSLDLHKLHATGYRPLDWRAGVRGFLAASQAASR